LKSSKASLADHKGPFVQQWLNHFSMDEKRAHDEKREHEMTQNANSLFDKFTNDNDWSKDFKTALAKANDLPRNYE